MTVLTVPEAKTHLNITAGDQDDEIQSFIEAAEAAIAQRCGPLEPTVVTSRVNSVGGYLTLPQYPVVSLTSITPQGGTALVLDSIVTDMPTGVIGYSYASETSAGGFNTMAHTVVYVAGRTTCPPDLLMAVKELVKAMWAGQRGGSKRPGTGGGDSYSNTLPGSAYSFPFNVERLIAPHERIGFA